MAFFDLSLDQLRSYLPPRAEPADFDAFWQQTLADARQTPLNATFHELSLASQAQDQRMQALGVLRRLGPCLIRSRF